MKKLRDLVANEEIRKSQSKETVEDPEKTRASKEEQKFIDHFKRLFGVANQDSLIIRLHQIYSSYHAMESSLQVGPEPQFGLI